MRWFINSIKNVHVVKLLSMYPGLYSSLSRLDFYNKLASYLKFGGSVFVFLITVQLDFFFFK